MRYGKRRNEIAMKTIKKTGLIIIIVLMIIQLIRPAQNKSDKVLHADISKLVSIQDTVQALLKNACYDCHSNNSSYPWYVNIQPAGWLMARHINHGKGVLNFSEFGNYSHRKQISKLTGIANSVRDNLMPLSSYMWMHKNARLNKNQSELIIEWARTAKDSLASQN